MKNLNRRHAGRAVAAAMGSHWVCNVLVGQSFMAAVDTYGLSAVYAVFGAVAVLGAAYVSAKVSQKIGEEQLQEWDCR